MNHTMSLVTAVSATLLVGSAHAATISLSDASVYANGTQINSSTRTVTLAQIDAGSSGSDFDLTGVDKLVVVAMYEGNGSGQPITELTYNGVAMTEAISDLSNGSTNQYVGIFYLDNPTTEGDLDFTFTGKTNGLGVAIYAPSGTASGGPAVTSATDGDGLSADITVNAGNTFIIAGHVNNNGDASAQSPLTSLMNSNVGSARGGSGYYSYEGAADTIELDFFITGTPSRPVTLSVGFEAVPEPGSLALMGIGGLLMLRRRRN